MKVTVHSAGAVGPGHPQALHFVAFALQGLLGYTEFLCIVAPHAGAWDPRAKETLYVRFMYGDFVFLFLC